MKILIVDDSSFKRKSLAYVIERHGHEVMQAVDGEEGLEKARNFMPDIIISDILMPRMDGFQFLRSIKRDERLCAIPFVFYSVVYTGEKDKELAFSLGASGFIEDIDKPEIFCQQLEEIIKKGRRKEGETCKPLIGEDEEFLRNYSRIVAAKLDDKVRELEKSIAERKKAEEKILKLSRVIEQSPVSVFITDAAGNIEYVNPKFTETTGYSPEEVIGKKPDILTSGTAAISDTGWRGEFLARKKNGETFWEYSTISPVINDKGDITNFIGINEDITGRKKMEDALRKSENKYRMLLENLEQKIFYKDRNSVYISCNENYANDLKIKPDEIAGRTDYEFYPKELAEKYRADDKRLMEMGKTEDIEEKYIQDGQELWVHTVKTPVRDESGNVTGILGIFWDITEKKEAEESMKKQLDELMRFEKATIQREFRMKELKEEVKRLKERIGEMEKKK